jgi:phage I-like protein
VFDQVTKLSYFADLSNVKLDEVSGVTRSWIQAFPYGEYHHPTHGELEFTPERAKRFASNVKANVRGQELDVDYDHKAVDGKAAGWVKDADARADGLWLLVEWTQPAATKVTHQDVLNRGGITNRPFLKGILPINLTEVLAHHGKEKPVPLTGHMKTVAEKLGLDENATEDAVVSALEGKLVPPPSTEPPQLSEEDKNNKKLADELAKVSKPVADAFTSLMESNRKLSEQVLAGETRAQNAELAKKLSELSTPDNIVPPAVISELTAGLVGLPTKLQETLIGAVKKLTTGGTISTGELGGGAPPKLESESDRANVVKQYGERIERIMADEKMDVGAAAIALSEREPKLFLNYRRAVSNHEGQGVQL